MDGESPQILALDFDGVLCDGLREYFQTTCRTYQQIWSTNSLEAWAEPFYRLRPVIETGWEMPVLLRALVLGLPETELAHNWSAIAPQVMDSEGLDSRDLAHRLDQTRDHWLQNDLPGWLRLHRFYPGVCDQLQAWLRAGSPQLFIITTKEGRFVQRLLQDQGLPLPAPQIFGKEVQQPKAATLRQLRAATQPTPDLWFVEDRLQTLQTIAAQPDLASVSLFLATWGYNTATAQAIAQADPHLHPLSLAQFTGDLRAWRST